MACGCGCGKAEEDRPAPPPARAIDAAPPRPKAYVYDAERCGDCHDRMFQEWRGSAHARAASSPTYVAMRAAAAAPDGCPTCHEPLAAPAPGTVAAREGVTCDVCHTIEKVDVADGRAAVSLTVGQPVRRGPFCELDDHYFHRMGCSPLHETSELCAGCHHLTAPLPIYTSYQEWRASRYAREGVQCQDCHMPAARAPIAEGAAERDGIGHHGMMGTGALRGGALALTLTAARDGEHVRVTAVVTNRGAGHHLPTDMPDRRLVLRVTLLDASGREVAQAEQLFGRVMRDASGAPAPYVRAATAGEDTRIAAGASATRTFRLEAPPRGTARAELFRRPLDHDVARAIGVAAPPDELIVRAEQRLRSP